VACIPGQQIGRKCDLSPDQIPKIFLTNKTLLQRFHAISLELYIYLFYPHYAQLCIEEILTGQTSDPQVLQSYGGLILVGNQVSTNSVWNLIFLLVRKYWSLWGGPERRDVE
jgi:hypothetical protein